MSDSVAWLALSIAILALGLAIFFDDRLRGMVTEVKRVEIDEKTAMLFFYGSKNSQRMLSDLRSVERVADSADSIQAQEILDGSDAFLATFKAQYPAMASDAEKIIESVKAKATRRLKKT